MLKEITINHSPGSKDIYPFNVPAIQTLEKLAFNNRVTFFVGENGSGKSTLLEAIATKVGITAEGGEKYFIHKITDEVSGSSADLANMMRFSWSKKLLNIYFFRAENFYNLSTGVMYGGKYLHDMSHGQSFLTLFGHRLARDGFYLFDEPEAALSVQKQLSFLVWLHEFITQTEGQCIIATHSPIILSFPDAQILSFDGGTIHPVNYKETDNYTLTKDFLNNPESYLRHLLQ